jgi:hypothetical protein
MKIEMLGLRRKILATCACAAIAVAPCGRAQASANQLCAAAGLGSGCIGAVKLSGMSRRGMSGPGSVSPSGLLGGLFTTVILSIVDDAVTSSPEVASASGTATSLSSDMSARASTLRANMDARPRLLDEQNRFLVSSMLDTTASTSLIDSTADMRPLEQESTDAGWAFDRGSPVDADQLWTDNDAMFSTNENAPGYSYTATISRDPVYQLRRSSRSGCSSISPASANFATASSVTVGSSSGVDTPRVTQRWSLRPSPRSLGY